MESGNTVVHRTAVHYYIPSQLWSVPHLQEKKKNETRKQPLKEKVHVSLGARGWEHIILLQ